MSFLVPVFHDAYLLQGYRFCTVWTPPPEAASPQRTNPRPKAKPKPQPTPDVPADTTMDEIQNSVPKKVLKDVIPVDILDGSRTTISEQELEDMVSKSSRIIVITDAGNQEQIICVFSSCNDSAPSDSELKCK